MKLNELRDKIYQNAVDKGFWDGTEEGFSLPEKLVLMHSEVSAALEADRIGRHFNKENLLANELENKDKYIFLGAFSQAVKDTLEDELADIVIRCLDLCGKLEINVDTDVERKIDIFTREPAFLKAALGDTIPSSLCFVHMLISDAYKAYFCNDISSHLTGVISAVIMIARYSGSNIEKHIEMKMRYNSIIG